MNMKYLVCTFIAASSIAASASAIQFITGGGRGHEFVTTTGDRIAAGSLVRVGYLTTADNLSTFTEFATTTISNPSNTLLVGGFLTIPASSVTVAQAAKGAQIYLWVYNSATAGTATQAGIFTSTDTTWHIPASFTGDPTEVSNLSLSLASGITALADPATPGQAPSVAQGPITLNGTTATGNIFRLGGVGVPEPGTASLLILGLAAIGRRKR